MRGDIGLTRGRGFGDVQAVGQPNEEGIQMDRHFCVLHPNERVEHYQGSCMGEPNKGIQTEKSGG